MALHNLRDVCQKRQRRHLSLTDNCSLTTVMLTALLSVLNRYIHDVEEVYSVGRKFLLYTTENVLPKGKGEQCNSQVSHHRPCRGRESCYGLGQRKVVDREALRQTRWIKRHFGSGRH